MKNRKGPDSPARRQALPEEIAELNRSVAAIQVRGARMPPMVQAWSDVEAPPRRS